MKRVIYSVMIAATVVQINTAVSYAQSKESADLKSFRKGSTPHEVGKRIANHYIAGPHTNFNRSTPPKVITYPEICTWYGALTFAKVTKDQTLVNQLKQRFEPLFGSRHTLLSKPDHVDYSVFGAVPLVEGQNATNKQGFS